MPKTSSNGTEIVTDTIICREVRSSVGNLTFTPASGNITIAGNINPLLSGSFNIGTISQRWNNIQNINNVVSNISSPSGDITIVPASNELKIAADVTPVTNDLYKLGNGTVRWLNANATSTYTDRVETVSSNTLTVVGVNVRCQGNLVPNSNNTFSLGTSSLKWNTMDVVTSRTDNINNSTSNTDLTLSVSSGKDIKVNNSILPVTDNIHSIGTSSFRFLQSNVSDLMRFDPRSNFLQSATFTVTTSWADVVGFNKITSSPYFDPGQNDNFKIPTKGYYVFYFRSQAAIGVTTNSFLWRLRNSSSTVFRYSERHVTGPLSSAFVEAEMYIIWECQSPGEILRLQAKANSDNVTDVFIPDGRIFQIQQWP